MIPRWLRSLLTRVQELADAEPFDVEIEMAPEPTGPTVSDLDRALEKILAHEGGWSDHPADRGGKTMYGVTHATLAQARRTIAGLPENIRDLTRDQARQIYHELYWRPSGSDALPWPVCYAHMDAAVQHGVGRANRWLQEAVGTQADGVVGPATRARLAQVTDWKKVAAFILVRRATFYLRILANPDQAVFARGWANRLDDVGKVTIAA